MKHFNIPTFLSALAVTFFCLSCQNNGASRSERLAETARQQFLEKTRLTGGVEYKSFKATIVNNGQPFSQPYTDAPAIHVNDMHDSILIGMGNGRVVLKPSDKKGVYVTKTMVDNRPFEVKAYRTLEKGRIDSVSIDGKVGQGSATIFYKPTV